MANNAEPEITFAEMMGLLDMPNKELCDDTRSKLLKQLDKVKDSWLIAGLVEYFIESNSSQTLDLILSAPEHHDKHFLNLVTDGLKQPLRRFHYTCLLFYGITKNPPPSWLRRLPRHPAIKELLTGLDPAATCGSLVAGVMVVIVLVTIAPQDVAKHCLTQVLDMFWRLAHWTPKRPQDQVLTDYLRVPICSLFTRLYAMFPCNVVNYIRGYTLGKVNNSFFVSTLQPMIERVRLHPLLFTFDKEREVDKFIGTRDFNQAIMECNHYSLDSMESTCEDPPLITDPQVCSASFVESNKCWMHARCENFFWSPSHTQSPNPVHLELPPSGMHTPLLTPISTPIYTNRTPLRVSLPIPESPPEAAVEATPETTPYTTPLLSDANRQILAQNIRLPSPLGTMQSQLSQLTADQHMSKMYLPKKKSAMMNKLNDVRKEREQLSAKNAMSIFDIQQQQLQHEQQKQQLQLQQSRNGEPNDKLLDKSPLDSSGCSSVGTNNENFALCKSKTNNRSILSSDGESSNRSLPVTVGADSNNGYGPDRPPRAPATPSERPPPPAVGASSNGVAEEGRSRKKSVFVQPSLDLLCFTAADTAAQSADETADSPCLQPPSDESTRLTAEEKDLLEGDEQRKTSLDTNGSANEDEDGAEEQGLGPPPVTSLRELVKSTKSNRLRFLSQCGPPLDLAQIESIMPAEMRKRKSAPSTTKRRTRSRSCSSLELSNSQVPVISKTSEKKTTLALTSKTMVSKCDADTQTQSHTVIDPYEKLMETYLSTLSKPATSSTGSSDQNGAPSPHQLLDNYIHRTVISCSQPLVNFDARKLRGVDEKLTNQIYAMHCLLLLERHKREIHANRNRRILAKAKKMYVQAEEIKSLKGRLETFQEEMREVRSSNQYMSSCYQRMKDLRDRDESEKLAVMREYGEGKQLELAGSVITSLSRTVKTSKGEDQKEKVIVILHRPVENKDDKVKDHLFRSLGALGRSLAQLREESIGLQMRVSQLEQSAAKCRTDQVDIDLLQREKEVMRQHMAIMKIQLTLKDELNLELNERVQCLEQSLFDSQSKHQQESQAWQERERVLMREQRAMRGVTSAVTLRLEQLQLEDERKAAESVAEAARKQQLSKTAALQQTVEELMKHNVDLELRLKQVSAEKEMLDKELHLLAGRSGYSRTGSSLPVAAVDCTAVGAGGGTNSSNRSAAASSTTPSTTTSTSSTTALPARKDRDSYFSSSAAQSELKALWREPAPPHRSKK